MEVVNTYLVMLNGTDFYTQMYQCINGNFFVNNGGRLDEVGLEEAQELAPDLFK